MDDWMERREALDLANRHFAVRTDEDGVIEVATKFFEFLTGKADEPAKATDETAPKLRTLIGWDSDDGDFVEDQRAYEVRPGFFQWAESREEAEGQGIGWKLPNEYYRFVDVETGETVK